MNCCRGRNRIAVLGRGVFVIASVLLVSCGGGGGGGSSTPTNADPTGYYSNTGKLSVNDGSVAPVNLTDMQGLIDGSTNHFTMLSATKQLAYDGTITVNGSSFTGTVTIYYQGTKVGTTTMPIKGDITSSGISNGVLSGSDPWGKGTFNLNYIAADNAKAALTKVEKVLDWMPIVVSDSSINIYPSNTAINFSVGTPSASGTFNACIFNGSINPLNSHLYSVTNVTFSSCQQTVPSSPNGTYSGLVTTRTKTTPDDTLVVILSNGTYSLSGEFQ